MRRNGSTDILVLVPESENQEATSRLPKPTRFFEDPWIRFSALFAVLVLLSEVTYYGVLLESALMNAYLGVMARISGELLGILGTEISVRGTTLSGGGFAVQISPECDALQLCAILTSAIVAFEAPLRSKLVGMVLGVIWLTLLNLVRIVSLYFVGSYDPSVFETAHETVWPVILIALTLASWVFWARRAVSEDPLPA